MVVGRSLWPAKIMIAKYTFANRSHSTAVPFTDGIVESTVKLTIIAICLAHWRQENRYWTGSNLEVYW